jgi:hypothetical protein
LLHLIEAPAPDDGLPATFQRWVVDRRLQGGRDCEGSPTYVGVDEVLHQHWIVRSQVDLMVDVRLVEQTEPTARANGSDDALEQLDLARTREPECAPLPSVEASNVMERQAAHNRVGLGNLHLFDGRDHGFERDLRGQRCRESGVSVRDRIDETECRCRPRLTAAGLAANLLALPASGGSPFTALQPTVAAAAPEAAQSDCLPTLSRGARGENVRFLQAKLNQDMLGTPPIAQDGVFGARTERRVRLYQRSVGLAVDGIVGPKTRFHGGVDIATSAAPTADGHADGHADGSAAAGEAAA